MCQDAKSLVLSGKEQRCGEKAVQTLRAAFLEISKEMAILLLRTKHGFSPPVSELQCSQLSFSALTVLQPPSLPTAPLKIPV